MVAAATRLPLSTAALAYAPLVRVGPPGGDRPVWDDGAEWEPAPALRPLRVLHSSGAAGLPYCDFLVDLAEAGTLIVDERVPTEFARYVEVWLDRGPEPGDREGRRNYFPVFAGEIYAQTIRVGEDPDERTLRAALLPERFGEALRGPLVSLPWSTESSDPEATEEVLLDGWPLEFNPEIAGKIAENRHDADVDHPEDEEIQLTPWRDPGAHYDEAAGRWTAPQAVRSLMQLAKGGAADAPWVRRLRVAGDGPDEEPDEDDLVYGGVPELADVSIPPGTYPPAALDAVLHPLGLDWKVKLVPESEGPAPFGEPPTLAIDLEVYRRGRGEVRTLKMQRPAGSAPPPRTGGDEPSPDAGGGEQLDLSRTDTAEVSHTLDLAAPPNVVHVIGAPRKTEIDVRLWPTFDPTPEADKRVWVANEDGRFTNPEDAGGYYVPEPPDWAGIGVIVPRRRTLEDRLATDSHGRRLPPALYWRRAAEAGEGGAITWEEAPPAWTWSLLEDRIGVRFDGDAVPPEILGYADAELAIVGAVVGDERAEVRTGPTGREPLTREKVLTIDASHRFKWETTYSGDFDFEVPDESVMPPSLLTAIEEFAEKILEEEEPAAADLAVTLPGLRSGYRIGDLLDRVEGRAIDLRRTRPGAGLLSEARPQVTGLEWAIEDLVTGLEIRQTGGGS